MVAAGASASYGVMKLHVADHSTGVPSPCTRGLARQ